MYHIPNGIDIWVHREKEMPLILSMRRAIAMGRRNEVLVITTSHTIIRFFLSYIFNFLAIKQSFDNTTMKRNFSHEPS